VINERVVAGDGKTMPSKNASVRDNFKCHEEARFPIRGAVIVYAWMQAVGIIRTALRGSMCTHYGTAAEFGLAMAAG
jgi:hypothetical protein